MNPQFAIKSFARGVKLTIQHVWTPATNIWNAAANADVQGQQAFAPFNMSWTWTPDSTSEFTFVNEDPKFVKPATCLPMVFPPPQGQFDAANKTFTFAPELTELSISFDQRANPFGIVDSSMAWPTTGVPVNAVPGMLTAAPLSRYDFSLKLIQKVPTVFAPASAQPFQPYQTVLTLDFPGEALFGGAAFNPYVVDGLSVFLNPYSSYYWVMQVPGLYYQPDETGTQTSSIVSDGSFVSIDPGDTVAIITTLTSSTNGIHTYSAALDHTDTVLTAMTKLAAAINGNNGYTASADGLVVNVSSLQATPFTGKTLIHKTSFPETTNYNFQFIPTSPPLAMPNFTLACKFRSPLQARDCNDTLGVVQNIPLKTEGNPQTSAIDFPEPVPAADALITGDDWQGVVTSLEQPLLDKLRSGWGRDPGTEADLFPWEQLAKDAGYQVINVQLFPNCRTTWGEDLLAGAPVNVFYGFPYLTNWPNLPSANQFSDQRLIRVPEGFVLHHVIVGQNCFPYPPNQDKTTYGVPNPYRQKVGVALYNGVRGDSMSMQQAAYLEWTESDYQQYLVDRLSLTLFEPGIASPNTDFRLLNCPLVWDSNNNALASYGGLNVNTGKPVWMGTGNSTTADREPIAGMPYNFAVTTRSPPATGGTENMLIVRWLMATPSDTPPNAVMVGPAGHHVILIGKQSVVGSDTGNQVVSGNPATGTW